MLKKYIFYFAWFCGVGLANAQTLTVSDSLSGFPLENVSITDVNGSKVVYTNSRGVANLSEFSGKAQLKLSLLGYETRVVYLNQLAEAGFKVLLVASASPLNEVVVSVSRWEQSTRKLPVKITRVDNHFTKFAAPQTAADMLGASGEVFIQKSQLGGGSPMIRGFATNRVLMTIDGVRMNTAIFRGGNLQNVISLDPLAVGSTEVLFGPASVIYGSDAIGGVMNFYTLKPVFSDSGKTFFNAGGQTRYSSANDEQTLHADVSVGFDKWAFVSSFTYTDFGDLRTGTHGNRRFLRDRYVKRIDGEDVQLTNNNPRRQVPTGFNMYHIMQKVAYQPTENWLLEGTFYFSSSSRYDRFDRLLRPRGDNLRSAEWFYGPQQWLLGSVAITHHADSLFYDSMKLTVAGQRLEESRHDRDLNNPVRDNTIENVDAYSVNVDFTKKIASDKSLFYGAEYVLNNVYSTAFSENIETGATEKIQTRYPDGSDWQSVAAYANFSWDISPQLSLQTGARYNFVSISADLDNTFIPFPFQKVRIDHGALTGSLGLNWRPGRGWLFRVNESTGFRSPNIDDVGKIFDSEPGSLVVPNPDLDPEYAWNTEVGVAKNFGQFLRIEASGFYTHLEDALVRRDFTFNGSNTIVFDGEESNVQAIQNAAFAYVWGFQYTVEARFFSHWSFLTRGNFQEGDERLDDGNSAPLRHAAPFFTDTHLIFRNQKLEADLFVNYNAEVSFNNLPPSERADVHLHALDKNGNPFTPSWYTLNLRTQYKLTPKITLGANIENITDQLYRTFSSGISAPGRNYIFSVKAVL